MKRERPTTNQTSVLPFTLANYGRDILFLRAMDWTGVDSNNDGVPDWWLWEYFGTLALNATNLDGDGNSLLSDYTNNVVPNAFSFTGISVTNNYDPSSSVPVQLAVTGYPYYVAVLVDDTNLNNAAWNPYSSATVTVNLGLVEGWHEVRIGLRGYADAATNAVWQWKRLKLDYTPPQLVVTQPMSGTVSVPMIQVQGFASEPLASITYDISNAAGIFTNLTGYVTGQNYDTNLLAFTTNYFQCYDIPLTSGLNTITVHAVDLAGNTTTTNVSFTLDYFGDHTAPALSVVWPLAGASIVDTSFTLQALVDDATATISASIVNTYGSTNTVAGLVEREGKVWVQDLPLGAGANTLTITATDTAGNTSTTSLTVYQSSVQVTVQPLTQLNQAFVTVRGTVNDPNVTLTVNGVAATISGDGTWEADNVQVKRSGAAILNVEVSSASQNRMAHALSGRMFQANDSSSGTDGSKQYVVRQPLTVGLTSYTGHQHLDSYGNDDAYSHWDETVDWTYDAGGFWHYTETVFYAPNDYENFSSDNTYGLPAGDPAIFEGSAILPPWEYADVSALKFYDGFTHWIWENTTQSRVMLEVQKPASATGEKLYLVQAAASEFSDPTDSRVDSTYGSLMNNSDLFGDAPLPPEWLTIQNQTLINSGVTNDDGAVWGYTVIQARAGASVDVTPSAKNFYAHDDYTFDVQATEINLQLAVDNNRDGNITFDMADQTTAAHPYRFWLNNDYDGYSGSIDDYADLDPSTGNDATNTTINCQRDLEDYTRLWLNVGDFVSKLESGELVVALEWTNTTGNPQVRLFLPEDWEAGGADYLTDKNAAAAQLADPCGQYLTDVNGQSAVKTNAPFLIPSDYWYWSSWINETPTNYLLFDAISRGSGQLVLALYAKDGVTKLAEGSGLYLKLQHVKEMYDRYTVGENPSAEPATTASLASGYSYDSTITAENNYILFVHGWNLETWEKDAFAETAFKRLYWQGYKGHFGAFQWPTGYGFGGDAWDVITDSRNFDNSESNAWASAPGLLGKLNDLNSTYPNHVYLIAHSMGNVVAGEALKLAETNQVVNTYVAMQGAISAHCYDNNTEDAPFPVFPGIVDDNTPNRYAHYPTNGAPCYFNGTAGAATYVNFYNANDFALNKWLFDQQTKPDHGLTSYPGYHYSSSSGFYKITGAGTSSTHYLDFPTNVYEIFAYCDEARCFALGAQVDVGGKFSGAQLDLKTIWPDDTSTSDTNQKYKAHKWHSAEFNFDNIQQKDFWNAVLGQSGFGLQ
ncbi:MAG: alpha/beta hydrolase [Verrucomicrobiae bacterium]